MSPASSATVVYTAASLRCVREAQLEPLIREIEGWIDSDGRISTPAYQGGIDVHSTWADALCLLALLQRPKFWKSRRGIRSLGKAVIRSQDPVTGGWSLRGHPNDPCHPIFCIYPTLGLLRALRVGSLSYADVQTSFQRLQRFCREVVEGETDGTTQLLALTCLRRLRDFSPTMISHARLATLRKSVESKQDHFRSPHPITVTDPAQPLWHVYIHKGLLYLAARGHWSATHPICIRLADHLLSQFDRENEGWRNVPRGKGIYSWSTALGILAAERLSCDIVKVGLNARLWLKRRTQVCAKRKRYSYDVALSFAGAERAVALRISRVLQEYGLVVFYDFDFRHRLLGEDLTISLQEMYFNKSRYAIAVLSRAFVRSRWAGNWEWRSILARMQRQKSAYLLPYFWEKVSVAGLKPTIAFMSRAQFSPEAFAMTVVRKVLRLGE